MIIGVRLILYSGVSKSEKCFLHFPATPSSPPLPRPQVFSLSSAFSRSREKFSASCKPEGKAKDGGQSITAARTESGHSDGFRQLRGCSASSWVKNLPGATHLPTSSLRALGGWTPPEAQSTPGIVVSDGRLSQRTRSARRPCPAPPQPAPTLPDKEVAGDATRSAGR